MDEARYSGVCAALGKRWIRLWTRHRLRFDRRMRGITLYRSCSCGRRVAPERTGSRRTWGSLRYAVAVKARLLSFAVGSRPMHACEIANTRNLTDCHEDIATPIIPCDIYFAGSVNGMDLRELEAHKYVYRCKRGGAGVGRQRFVAALMSLNRLRASSDSTPRKSVPSGSNLQMARFTMSR